ncbi:hypothetical protein EW026_g1991 [Hermanssonia centrifuga]|uniref:Uncharacterized protein n=1 Tax=Hermanssonia centrifuga TaxID=98765 RepID=A0A4V3XB43_9APHY|nr:hypothetical protein EW026_g1991 [Hermanssonia centrifuga]
MDSLMTPAPHYVPSRLYNVFPHPAQDASEKRRYVTMLTSSPIVGQQKRPVMNAAGFNIYGLTFDPYDYNPLPSRVLATGAAANFPSVSNLVGDIFNAPVLVPTTQIDAAQIVPHRNAPATGYPARAALGGAYVARWVWGKERGTSAGTGRGGFEEEVRRLLSKRWASSGGIPLRTSINTPPAGSKPGSGASTPYGHGGRSGLGANILIEVDEEDADDITAPNGSSLYGLGMGFDDVLDGNGRLRTYTGSTVGTTMSGTTLETSLTAYTTPDLGSGSPNPGDAAVAPGTTTLVPVTALPTSEAELQLGLAKVAEPDVDAFMSYASIVPEYCRLEGMLVKSIV